MKKMYGPNELSDSLIVSLPRRGREQIAEYAKVENSDLPDLKRLQGDSRFLVVLGIGGFNRVRHSEKLLV